MANGIAFLKLCLMAYAFSIGLLRAKIRKRCVYNRRLYNDLYSKNYSILCLLAHIYLKTLTVKYLYNLRFF